MESIKYEIQSELTQNDVPKTLSEVLETARNIERLILRLIPIPQSLDNYPLTIPKAAEILQVTKQTLYGYVDRGEIKFSKPKRQIYFNKQDLLDFMNSGKVITKREQSIEIADETDKFLSEQLIKKKNSKNDQKLVKGKPILRSKSKLNEAKSRTRR